MVTIDELRPGMKLGRTVWGTSRNPLLRRGVVLDSEYIRSLRNAGAEVVYVREPGWEDVVLPELVSEQVYRAVRQAATRAFTRLTGGRADPLSRVRAAVELLISDVLAAPQMVWAVRDLRAAGDHLFGHSVHVALLSLLVGKRLGLDRSGLIELGIGALLHDLGKAYIPERVLNKPGPLTEVEWQLMRDHPRLGYEALNKAGAGLLAAHIALQHHERVDGSGYPRALRRQEIHLYAQICGACDVLDASTSSRPYRHSALSAAEALEHLQAQAGRLYGERPVHALIQIVAPYPVASLVRLDDGSTAVVKQVHVPSLDRPEVRVFRAPGGQPMRQFVDLDLAAQPSRHIVQTLAKGIEFGEQERPAYRRTRCLSHGN